jgi:hypothetical protein
MVQHKGGDQLPDRRNLKTRFDGKIVNSVAVWRLNPAQAAVDAGIAGQPLHELFSSSTPPGDITEPINRAGEGGCPSGCGKIEIQIRSCTSICGRTERFHLSADAGIPSLVKFRLFGQDVDHTAQCITAVKHGIGPVHDIDVCDVIRTHAVQVLKISAAISGVVQSNAIDQKQQLIRPETADYG